MNEEIKSKNFDINAKYEDMILNAKSIVEHHLFVSDGSCEAPVYINLAYDVKNHLPTLIKEFQQLKSVNSFSKRTLYKINKDRLDANQRLLKENQKLKIEISARETVCDELQERINKAVEYIESSALEINTRDYGMLTVCNSDDLLDLLKGDKE